MVSDAAISWKLLSGQEYDKQEWTVLLPQSYIVPSGLWSISRFETFNLSQRSLNNTLKVPHLENNILC